jgi:hypothetical protein
MLPHRLALLLCGGDAEAEVSTESSTGTAAAPVRSCNNRIVAMVNNTAIVAWGCKAQAPDV